jgi:nitrate reductase NapAB chaperone NapD
MVSMDNAGVAVIGEYLEEWKVLEFILSSNMVYETQLETSLN